MIRNCKYILLSVKYNLTVPPRANFWRFCLKQIIIHFFALNHHNDAKWLVLYHDNLSNLKVKMMVMMTKTTTTMKIMSIILTRRITRLFTLWHNLNVWVVCAKLFNLSQGLLFRIIGLFPTVSKAALPPAPSGGKKLPPYGYAVTNFLEEYHVLHIDRIFQTR